MASLIIAIIGDPKVYKKVTYDFGGKTIKSNVSFDAIRINQSDLLVIAGLSLADLNKCSDYSSCVSDAKNIVINALGLSDDKIMVAPNVYGDSFTQQDRRLSLFFNFVYYNLLMFLDKTKPSNIFVDTTHGINYMQVMGKDAIELAVSAYTASQNNNVLLKVYNSEPVVAHSQGPYKIDEILSKKFNVKSSILSIVSNFLYPNAKNSFQKVIKQLSCDLDEVFSYASSLYAGMFPYLFETKCKIEMCLEKVEKELEKLNYGNPKIEVEIKNRKLVYKDPLVPIQTSYLHALLYVINKILSNYNENSLKNYYNFANNYVTSEIQRVVIQNEISRLKEKLKGKVKGKVRLSSISGVCDSPMKPCIIDKRNFYAHAGLECNSVYIDKCGDDFCVSYSECLDNVRNLLK
jgi:CRISPR-associated protein Csx1